MEYHYHLDIKEIIRIHTEASMKRIYDTMLLTDFQGADVAYELNLLSKRVQSLDSYQSDTVVNTIRNIPDILKDVVDSRADLYQNYKEPLLFFVRLPDGSTQKIIPR
jgi:hypothetical protein